MGYPCKLDVKARRVVFAGVQFRNENTREGWALEEIRYSLQTRKPEYFAIRFPPGSCWAGVGAGQRYVPAEIAIFKYDPKAKTADSIFEITVRPGSRR